MLDAVFDAARELVKRFSVRRVRTFERDRVSHVAALADVGVNFDLPEKSEAELFGGALAATL